MKTILWSLLKPYRNLAIAPGIYPIKKDIPKNLFRKGVHYDIIKKIDGQWCIVEPN